MDFGEFKTSKSKSLFLLDSNNNYELFVSLYFKFLVDYYF